MCRILGVSRAQYYRYRSPKPSKRRAEDEDLKQRILRIFTVNMTVNISAAVLT